MRTVWLREFGGPEVLVAGTAPDPVPGHGQVLISVAYASITYVETQFRRSGFGPNAAELPVIPGNGVGGVVAAVGDDVAADLVGRRVVASMGGSGGYAERAVVPAEALIEIPDGVSTDDAVALLADGRTALALLRAAEVAEGERVLVEAAAGGVGSLLVQLARTAGAVVVAAAGGERKVSLARGLGAHEAVDYRSPDWAAEAGRFDVVFDGVGGAIGRSAFDLLGPGGRMLSHGLASGDWADVPAELAASRGVALVRLRLTPESSRVLTAEVLAEAAAGRLRPLIGQRFPLARAADAHAAIESRMTVGKTLLVI